MSYKSPGIEAYEVIDDSNWQQYADGVSVDGKMMSRGYVKRETPYCEGVGKAIDIPRITEQDAKEIIKEREAKGLGMLALRKRNKGIPTQNQNGIPYCWIYGITQCLHYMQALAGEEVRVLRPESGGAVIKQGRSVGGWGDEALEHIVKYGLVEASLWPEHSLDYRKYWTDEAKENASKSIVTEWYDGKPGDFEDFLTLALNDHPCGLAFNWWGHLVCGVDAVIDERGEICAVIDNSHNDGIKILKGSQKIPSEINGLAVMHSN